MAVQAQVIARPAESPTARIARYQAEADLALSLWQDLERLLENNKLRDGDGLTPEEVKRLSGKACKARATYWCKRDKIERLRAHGGPRVAVLPLERTPDHGAQLRGSAALPGNGLSRPGELDHVGQVAPRTGFGVVMMAVGVALLVVGAIAFATALLWGWATTSLEVILALIVVIGAVLLGWDVARHNQERR
jgi:hypothetical protein